MRAKTVIVDKDSKQMSEIINMLSGTDSHEFEIIKTFRDVNDALSFVAANDVDVVFANTRGSEDDIMGLAMIYNLSLSKKEVISILYSHNEADAWQSMDMGAFSYYCLNAGPVSFLRLLERIRRQLSLLRFSKSAQGRSIMVKTRNGLQIVAVDEILFVERLNRKIRIVCDGGLVIPITGHSMEELDQILSVGHFYRCYQSFIVNLEKIKFVRMNNDYKNYVLQLREYDGEIIISRERLQQLIDLLKEQYTHIKL